MPKKLDSNLWTISSNLSRGFNGFLLSLMTSHEHSILYFQQRICLKIGV